VKERDEQRPHEWFDDDAFWIDSYEAIFPRARFEVMPEVVDNVLTLLDVEPCDVLDLCCGPGRYAVELARRGFRVTGVDRTRFLLERAQARALEAGVEVEWIRSDMRDFVRPEAFDLAMSMFTSFGYFDDKHEDLRVLRQLHRCLRPGGRVIVDVMGKEILARVFAPNSIRELDDGTLVVERREIFDDWTRVRCEWMLIRDERIKTYQFHHTVYSGQELVDRLHETGFTGIRLFGGLTGRAYDRDANRLVAIADKEAG
jgi:SAM-dependent methyltransferase